MSHAFGSRHNAKDSGFRVSDFGWKLVRGVGRVQG
jgi:hypothetical protein